MVGSRVGDGDGSEVGSKLMVGANVGSGVGLDEVGLGLGPDKIVDQGRVCERFSSLLFHR